MNTEPCGCKVSMGYWWPQTYKLTYCPLHAAAPELLEALKDVKDYFWGDDTPVKTEYDVQEFAEQAIAKAKGPKS